jgi:hypothetical protein
MASNCFFDQLLPAYEQLVHLLTPQYIYVSEMLTARVAVHKTAAANIEVVHPAAASTAAVSFSCCDYVIMQPVDAHQAAVSI